MVIVLGKDLDNIPDTKTWTHQFCLFDGAVTVARRRELKSKIWYYRFWVASEEKTRTISTGTRCRSEATEIATTAYLEARIKVKNNMPVFDHTWKKTFVKYRAELNNQLLLGDLSEGYHSRLISAFELYVERYFTKRKINDLKQDSIDSFWDWRRKFWTTTEGKKVRKERGIHRVANDPSHDQLKECIPVLKRMVELAKNSGDLPEGRIIKIQNPKKANDPDRVPAFERGQWIRMKTFINDVWALEKIPKKQLYRRRMFQMYFNLMVETGMRMESAQILKWRDVHIETSSVRFKASGKGHFYDPVGPRKLAALLQNWRRNDPDNMWSNDEDHVFVWKDGVPPTDQQLDSLLKQVQRAAEKTEDYNNISIDSEGRRLNCNSFRHTYAVFHRRYYATSIEDIAANMGNTVPICSKHYAKIQPIQIAERVAKDFDGESESWEEILKNDAMLCGAIVEGDTFAPDDIKRLAEKLYIDMPSWESVILERKVAEVLKEQNDKGR